MEVCIRLLVNRDVRLDRINLRDGCENGTWSNKVSDLHLSDPRDSLDQGSNFCPFQIEFRLFYICFCSLNLRLSCQFPLNLGIELALRNRFCFCQRSISFHIKARFAKLCFHLCLLRFCEIECILKRTRVNFKENLSFFHNRSFNVILLNDVTRNAWLNLCVHKSIECCDVLAVDRCVLLYNRSYFHCWWRWSRCCFGGTTRKRKQQKQRSVS